MKTESLIAFALTHSDIPATMKALRDDRVRLNSNVAWAFVDQCGSIESMRPDSVLKDRAIYVVKLDTPTAPATNWTPAETLGVSPECIEAL